LPKKCTRLFAPLWCRGKGRTGAKLNLARIFARNEAGLNEEINEHLCMIPDTHFSLIMKLDIYLDTLAETWQEI